MAEVRVHQGVYSLYRYANRYPLDYRNYRRGNQIEQLFGRRKS